MTKTEVKQLVKLLNKLKNDGLQPPNTPLEVWLEFNRLLPLPTVEILVTRNGRDFLLTERHDQYWNGWHIPGGFMLYKETVEGACQRLARKELGIKVVVNQVIDVYVWQDHAYGAPVSIVCLCSANREPKDGQFFTKIPKETISRHVKFLNNFLKRNPRPEVIKSS